MAEDVKIEWPLGQDQQKKDLQDNLKDVKQIIAVASGKGGVGKSTVTANLARALALDGYKVGLLDADIFGPSIPTLFHLEEAQPEVDEIDNKTRIQPVEKEGLKIISIGFFVAPEKALLWRGPMASNALRQLFTEVNWGQLDYLLIDLPPGTSDIHITIAQMVPITGVVIVTTPQELAVADVRKAIDMFRDPHLNIPVLGLVENMAYFTPTELPDSKYYIFGQGGGERLSKEFNLPILAEIPILMPGLKPDYKDYLKILNV